MALARVPDVADEPVITFLPSINIPSEAAAVEWFASLLLDPTTLVPAQGVRTDNQPAPASGDAGGDDSRRRAGAKSR